MPKRSRNTAAMLTVSLLAAACSSGGAERAAREANEAAMPRVIAEPMGLLFAGMDTNGDAETSRAEAEFAVPKVFAAADADKNGILRPIEFQAFAIKYLGTNNTALAAQSFDQNLNGQVTAAEFTGFLLTRFEETDTSGDGVLQRSEFIETIQPGVRGNGQGARGGNRGPGGRRR
ncbi:MAG: hypothetical protein AAGH41_03765 [Pseudomonadota bacterium]